ncbi:MAG: gliding motility lipoprotein GldD [Flavobacteriales bacterium]|nr:gliding motility lipoprotein GldD [Flavobacteriia bacterium]NCP05993.1 gliding motility lipoprotein GldD [Flavobacteriales bacterium]PIV92756.1 MAG: gliding motility lipoprotein GldD [Flavobacteriaceae bacterium CG17_big_fil_post_rev_8_21_14_2_50_33_15]PIY10231.1 MAG: gliding motility lipoprotein GldD [Flavobacteriaceae bacterium CG_4_10_14_3_um_filter_33_47]PJB18866.1 MAG: gliding motility lipoprotein GldD [Flavobacteriaceae bacterium CG_4_9_14_3_um_filter_33_16]
MKPYYFLGLVFIFCMACHDDVIPKPKGYLRLEYPKANYIVSHIDGTPFSFEANTLASNINLKKLVSTTKSYGVNVEYPTLKGTIYLTYKSINNSQETLIDFLRDAQNFTQKHTRKADEIKETEYINKLNKVYGMFYEVGGNAASQSQFYVTDSTDHFLTGSLYFYAKPNYDSIYPAAKYLEKDIKHIMETVKWK